MSAFFALAPALCSAAEGEAVYLNLQTGTSVTFLFAEKPVVALEAGDSLTMRTTEAEVKYAYSDVRSLTFEKVDTIPDTPDGIAKILGDAAGSNGNVAFRIGQNGITVVGLPAGASASVYTVSGAMVANGKANGNNGVFLPIGQEKTVYIVHTSTGQSYKFIRK